MVDELAICIVREVPAGCDDRFQRIRSRNGKHPVSTLGPDRDRGRIRRVQPGLFRTEHVRFVVACLILRVRVQWPTIERLDH